MIFLPCEKPPKRINHESVSKECLIIDNHAQYKVGRYSYEAKKWLPDYNGLPLLYVELQDFKIDEDKCKLNGIKIDEINMDIFLKFCGIKAGYENDVNLVKKIKSIEKAGKNLTVKKQVKKKSKAGEQSSMF